MFPAPMVVDCIAFALKLLDWRSPSLQRSVIVFFADGTGSALGFATMMAFSWLSSSLSKGHARGQRAQLPLSPTPIGQGKHRIYLADRLLQPTTILEEY